MITTIEQVIKEYTDIFYLENTDLIPLVCAVIAQSMTEGDPIWLWLVGGSSSGKTELLNALGDIPFAKQISTLTENTFLSGAKSKNGKEVSLLKQMRNGCIIMKDFTSILTMNNEKKEAILGQMREIFDGHFTKATGTGDFLEWKGKMNFIAGVTEAIHADSDQINKMGTRNVFYTLPEQDRIATTLRRMANLKTINAKREHLKNIFSEYVKYLMEQAQSNYYEIPEDITLSIVYLADFASRATTGVVKNYRGEKQLVLSPNMPMRLASQISGIGSMFMSMNNGVFPEWGKRIIYKSILDCIPKQRRMVLTVLAKYRECSTKAISMNLGYEVDLVSQWLGDLDALKICKRIINQDLGKTRWVLNEDYRQLLLKYDGIKYIDETYDACIPNQSYVNELDEISEKEEDKKQNEELFKAF